MSLIRNIIENERPDIHGTGRLSTVASNVLLSGNLALENYAVTKNFATVLYTGNGATQDITTGISSVDFTTSVNGSGYWLDRSTFEVKTDTGDVVTSGECVVNTSKVHIKERSDVDKNVIIDGLRGKGTQIHTDATDEELTGLDNIQSFNVDGVTVATRLDVNEDTETYVLYQTLYTHIKWGTTNQDKKYVEAFNPVTRETMIMYEGSGNAGHEIPHSLGVELDYSVVKKLTGASDWIGNTSLNEDDSYFTLNTDIAFGNTNVFFNSLKPSSSSIYLGTHSYTNGDTDTLILYGKAKSENWTIVEYTGTGVAGNFVETKDVYGVPRKPRRVIIKRVDDTGDWVTIDTERLYGLIGAYSVNLNESDAEAASNAASPGVVDIDMSSIGAITLNTGNSVADTMYNASGGQYIALVEFDTNSNGGDGYFNMPTDDSNLNLTDGVFSYTDGKDSNGYVRSTESLTGTTTIDFAGVNDGKHWVAKAKDGGYGFYKGLSNGLYNKEYADDNRLVFNPDDGKVYSTTGGELIINGTFDVDTSGWAAVNDANLSIDSGRLAVNANTTDYPIASQTLNVEIGVSYKVSIGEASGISPVVQMLVEGVRTSVYDGDIVTFSTINPYINLRMYGTGDDDTAYFDDVSVYKLEATLDQPISPISFLPNPIMVASETPQYIDYSEELAANVMESLDVSNTIKCDSYLGKNACTAWVNFDGTTTPPTIRDSFNVRDVVRIGTGRFKIILEGLENMNFSAAVTTGNYNENPASRFATLSWFSPDKINLSVQNEGTTSFDTVQISVQIFGGKE